MIKSFDICQFFCIFSQSPEVYTTEPDADPDPEPISETIMDVLDIEPESVIPGEIVLISVSNIPEISERKKRYYKIYKKKKIQSRKSKTVVCVIT